MDDSDGKPPNNGDSPENNKPSVKKEKSFQPYQTGYGKPPVHTRFKRGQSGNPKGRPKDSLNLKTLFTKELKKTIVGTENGRRKTFKTAEAMMKRLTSSAVSGNARALDMSLKLWSATSVEEANQPLEEEDRKVWANLVDRIKSMDKEQECIKYLSQPQQKCRLYCITICFPSLSVASTN